MQCPRCNYPIPDGSPRCNVCGAVFPAPVQPAYPDNPPQQAPPQAAPRQYPQQAPPQEAPRQGAQSARPNSQYPQQGAYPPQQQYYPQYQQPVYRPSPSPYVQQSRPRPPAAAHLQPKLEMESSEPQKFALEPGHIYIVNEKKYQRSIEIFSDYLRHNHYGLSISREHPSNLRNAHNLTATPMLWLTDRQECQICIHPQQIGKLFNILEDFLTQTSHAMVLIEGLDYLIVQNDFMKVLRIVQKMKDLATTSSSTILVPLETAVLEPREVSILEREARSYEPAALGSAVEDLFFIYRDGRLISHETRRLKPMMDDQVLSGMLTAIQEFVKDALSAGGETAVLGSMEYGNKRIVLERGDLVGVAVVFIGDPPRDARDRLKTGIKQMEEQFGDELKSWTGDSSALEGPRKLVHKMIEDQ